MEKRRFGARLTVLLLCLGLLAGCGGRASTANLPGRPDGHVLDVAGVLSRDTAADLNARSGTLADKTGGAVTVVTVDVLSGRTVSEYANALFEDWALGGKDVLVLLAVGDQTYHILQGRDLAKAFPDEALDEDAWNYLERDFAAGNYDAGAANLFDALERRYEICFDLVPEEDASEAPAHQAKGGGLPVVAIIVLAVAVAAVLLLVVLKLSLGRKKGRRSGGPSARGRYRGRRRG